MTRSEAFVIGLVLAVLIAVVANLLLALTDRSRGEQRTIIVTAPIDSQLRDLSATRPDRAEVIQR